MTTFECLGCGHKDVIGKLVHWAVDNILYHKTCPVCHSPNLNIIIIPTDKHWWINKFDEYIKNIFTTH